jgi:hypothetical protein
MVLDPRSHRASRLAMALCLIGAAGACGSHSTPDNPSSGPVDSGGSGSGANSGANSGASSGSGGSGAEGGTLGDDAGGSAVIDGGAPDAAPVGDATGVAAARATDFLSTIGVCVHIAQGVDAPKDSATAMAYAGIRNLRDDGNPNAVAGWITVYQQAGVRTCMLPNSDLPTTISMAKQLRTAGALLAVEGPNEPNNFPVTYEGQKSSGASFTPVAHFQRDLYAAVHAESTLSGVPVFHSSEAGGSEPDDVGLQFLTIPGDAGTTMPAGTKYADYGNPTTTFAVTATSWSTTSAGRRAIPR